MLLLQQVTGSINPKTPPAFVFKYLTCLGFIWYSAKPSICVSLICRSWFTLWLSVSAEGRWHFVSKLSTLPSVPLWFPPPAYPPFYCQSNSSSRLWSLTPRLLLIYPLSPIHSTCFPETWPGQCLDNVRVQMEIIGNSETLPTANGSCIASGKLMKEHFAFK